MSAHDPVALLHLLQLADSAFPTGNFAQSYGLEALVMHGWLDLGADSPQTRRDEALGRLLAARVAAEWARGDFPLVLYAHREAVAGDSEALVALDTVAHALRAVGEWRRAGGRAGRRLLAAVVDFAPAPLLLELVAHGRTHPDGLQLPVAFGAAAAVLGCASQPTLTSFAYTAVSGQIAAAVRLGVTGQRGAQRIMHTLKPELRRALTVASALDLDDIGASLPLLELAGMVHEQAHERLFSS